jgi:hypothetical protein
MGGKTDSICGSTGNQRLKKILICMASVFFAQGAAGWSIATRRRPTMIRITIEISRNDGMSIKYEHNKRGVLYEFLKRRKIDALLIERELLEKELNQLKKERMDTIAKDVKRACSGWEAAKNRKRNELVLRLKTAKPGTLVEVDDVRDVPTTKTNFAPGADYLNADYWNRVAENNKCQ